MADGLRGVGQVIVGAGDDGLTAAVSRTFGPGLPAPGTVLEDLHG